MKRKICLLLFSSTVLLNQSSVAQYLWRIGEGTVRQWYYKDGDEFNGSTLDKSKWDTGYPWGRHLYCGAELAYYTDEDNLTFEKGVISMTAKKEHIKAKAVPFENDDYQLVCNGNPIGSQNLKDFEYTSGMIFSRQKYQYGLFECSFRVDEGKGLWPAFWLFVGEPNYEIDIMEIVGYRNSDFHVDMHCPDGCNNYKTTLGLVKKNYGDFVKTNKDWKDGYNTVAVEWAPGYIRWYLNGIGVAYWKGLYVKPSWLIANLTVASDASPFGPGPDNAKIFPAKFDIDYIRVWTSEAAQAGPVTVLGNATVDKNEKLSAGNAKPVKFTRPEYRKKYLKGEYVFATLAMNHQDTWTLNITGQPSEDFEVRLTDPSGNTVYVSSEIGIHEFKPVAADRSYKLKIRNSGGVAEHKL